MRNFAVCTIAIVLLFSCATGQDRKQAGLHYKLGLSYLENERYQPAFIEFQKALEYDRENKEIYNALGFVYLKFEDLPNAKRSFQRAVALDRNYSDAWNNLCSVNNMAGEYGEAVANCDKALANPLYTTPHKAFYNLGMAQYKLGNHEAASRAFRDALRRAPEFYPSYYALAIVHKGSREYGLAGEALEKAVKMDPAFTGDMERAETDIMQRKVLPVEEGEIDNLLEIFRY